MKIYDNLSLIIMEYLIFNAKNWAILQTLFNVIGHAIDDHTMSTWFNMIWNFFYYKNDRTA